MDEKRLKNMESMAMKMLRQERKQCINRARGSIKEQNKIIKDLRQALSGEGKTIPELAEAVDMETELVLRYVSTLKKYGIIGEGSKDGDYFKYELIG